MTESFPFTLFQIISFSACMGARSTPEKSILLLSLAPTEFFVFFALRSTCGAITLNGFTTGVVPKEANMGIAAASNWLIGGSPSNSSIERTMDEVV